jgi:peptidylprolyl isomerase
MLQAKIGDTVLVHYTGKLQDGTVFDSSADRDPLQFALGAGDVIPGFESAIVGMSPGESKTQNIPCDQAYGPHRPDMVAVVGREQIPADLPLEIGMELELQHPSGQVIPVTITEIAGAEITLDANHPLAGQDLTFEINLVEVGT